MVVGLKADRRRFGAIHDPFHPKTLTEAVQRQQGKRAENKRACVCVNKREREREWRGLGGSGSCGHEFE